MITLTDTAATKVKDLIEAEGEPNLALRVAVRPGGCSGFSYEMFFDTDVADDDNLVDYSGVQVVVDASSAELLAGRHPRLQGRPPGRRVRHRQPERAAQLRLRQVLQLSPPLHRRQAGHHGSAGAAAAICSARVDGVAHQHAPAGETHAPRASIGVGLIGAAGRLEAQRPPRLPPTPTGLDAGGRSPPARRPSRWASATASWCCGSKRRTTASTSSTGSSPARSAQARSATRSVL